MRRRTEALLWTGVALTLATFAIPWFLWGSSVVVAGLPVWVWWHIGWLGLTSLVFYVFTQRAWGLGIERRGGEVDG
jgi:hypothetical protein